MKNFPQNINYYLTSRTFALANIMPGRETSKQLVKGTAGYYRLQNASESLISSLI